MNEKYLYHHYYTWLVSAGKEKQVLAAGFPRDDNDGYCLCTGPIIFAVEHAAAPVKGCIGDRSKPLSHMKGTDRNDHALNQPLLYKCWRALEMI